MKNVILRVILLWLAGTNLTTVIETSGTKETELFTQAPLERLGCREQLLFLPNQRFQTRPR